ncbi:MAG: spermidine synthase [Halobacteriaceae archaeon]
MDRRPRVSAVELAVFVSGVTSIGLEILAGRVVAPAFGSSIYVWGSVIGVTLAALGVGYHFGGRRAQGRASRRRIAAVCLLSALSVAVLLLAGEAVLRAADALSVPPRLAPLLPVAVLFGPPVFCLGFVSPYAAEISAAESTGAAAGRVYAVGTAGSLVGAFGTTFVLVPALSVATVEVGFGLLLAGTALLLAVRGEAPGTAPGAAAVALVLVAAFAVHGAGFGTPGTTVYETETAYQHLSVVDDGGVRTLYLDGQPQSATYVDGREGYVFTYSRYLHLPMLLTEDVDRVLFVGGGGFSSPKRYLREYPNVSVDVVELDPAVVRAAREYFAVPDSPRLSVHVGDGREFLERTNRTYDVVVLDAYRKDRVPFHLTTADFFGLVADRLDDDGVLVANVIAARTGPASAFYRAEFATMETAFPHVAAFPTSDRSGLQNVELLAAKRPFSRSLLSERARQRSVGVSLFGAVERYRDDVPTDDVPVLRDDRAPVEHLLDPQLGRRYVVERTNETVG